MSPLMDLQEEAVTGPKKVRYRATYSNISPSILYRTPNATQSIHNNEPLLLKLANDTSKLLI